MKRNRKKNIPLNQKLFLGSDYVLAEYDFYHEYVRKKECLNRDLTGRCGKNGPFVSQVPERWFENWPEAFSAMGLL